MTPTPGLSLAEFDELFESVKNWGRWGPDDDRGALNFITPARTVAAMALISAVMRRATSSGTSRGGKATRSGHGRSLVTLLGKPRCCCILAISENKVPVAHVVPNDA